MGVLKSIVSPIPLLAPVNWGFDCIETVKQSRILARFAKEQGDIPNPETVGWFNASTVFIHSTLVRGAAYCGARLAGELFKATLGAHIQSQAAYELVGAAYELTGLVIGYKVTDWPVMLLSNAVMIPVFYGAYGWNNETMQKVRELYRMLYGPI